MHVRLHAIIVFRRRFIYLTFDLNLNIQKLNSGSQQFYRQCVLNTALQYVYEMSMIMMSIVIFL